MGSRAPSTTKHCEPRIRRRRLRCSRAARRGRGWDASQPPAAGLSPFPPLLCLLPSHIPTDRCAAARTRRRAPGRIPRFRKTRLYGILLEMGSRARDRTQRPGGAPRPCPTASEPPGRPTLHRAPPPSGSATLLRPPYYTYLALREPGSTGRQGLLPYLPGPAGCSASPSTLWRSYK